jgi:AraC family ethanolamine operon transcriptional activator
MGTHPTLQNSGVRLIGRRFDDVDEATQVLSTYREAHIKPLSLEPFQSTIYQADFGDLTIIFGETSSPIYLTGERRPGFIQFGLPLQTAVQPTYVHQHLIDTHTLCGFDASREVNSIYPANIVLSEIQVRQDLFESTLAAMRRDDLDARFLKQELIHLPITLSVYHGYMQELMQLVKQQSPLLQRTDYRQMIIGDVLPLLIDAIPRREPNFYLRPHPRQQAKLVRRATEYMEAHIHEKLTLKDLYTTLGVSRRTLFYSFENVFGVTPMEYVKVQRLQGTRRSLKAADPKTASVVAIAHQWGFWHSGRFAQSYKALFHELPSQTLDSETCTSFSPD